MIRGNWSLSAEIRKNERKQQQKTQQRQKRTYNLEKLANVDPIKLYYKIERLKDQAETYKDKQYLKSLQADWNFIQDNKLHQEKLVPFFEKLEKEQKRRIARDSKLWGQKSIYFNPELNPLGKVPTSFGTHTLKKPLPNITASSKPHDIPSLSSYSLEDLDIVLPEGPQPKFYKEVFNTGEEKESTPDTNEPKEDEQEIQNNDIIDDSDDDNGSNSAESDHDDLYYKKQRLA